jgi:hypothetical protein
MLLETKAHGCQGKKTWFGSHYLPTSHDSIVIGLWFLLQVSGILPTFLTQTIEY